MILLTLYPTQHLLHTHTESLVRSTVLKLAPSLKKTLGVIRTAVYGHTHQNTSIRSKRYASP